MFHPLRFPVCVLLAGLGFSLGPGALSAQDSSYRGRKYKAPPAAAHIEVTVLKDYNGKPIEDAHVIFHPTEGDKDTGSLEVKTNDDGKAVIDVIPIGDTVTLQVIVNGYQTYGASYKVDKAALTMEVRLKRPGSQYSIYKNSGSNSGGGSGSSNSGSGSGSHAAGGAGSSSSGSSNAAPPASSGKSSGAQPNTQSQPPPK
jgi:hypothetical protein